MAEKLIFPPFQYTSIANRVLSLFGRFTTYHNFRAEMSENSYIRDFCAQVSEIGFLAYLTVLRLIVTVMS